jgi:ubiquinone/menaquinone biosynthesis C-methylase UbiE
MMADNFAHRAAEWDSPEKTKMTEIFVAEMLKHVSPQKEWRALEIGAGTGLVGMQVLSKVGCMVFEDTSAAMLGALKQKPTGGVSVETVHGEIFEYKKQDIDFAFSCMAFHHIPDVDGALSHLYDICNTGAVVVVGDLLSEDGSFHRFEPIPHKGFDLDVLKLKFVRSGFEVVVARVYHTLKRERTEGIFTEYEQFILVAVKR